MKVGVLCIKKEGVHFDTPPSFGRISSSWKKGFDFFYSSPKEEVNEDAQLNQGLGENVDASSESVEK